MKKVTFLLILATTLYLGCFEGNNVFAKDASQKISNDLKKKKIASIDYSNLDRKWTDEEIIQLGYMPGEVLVMFKKDRVNLKNSHEQDMARKFFSDRSPHVASAVMSRLARKRGRSLSSEVIPNIDEIEDNFMEVDEDLKFINTSVVKLKIDVSVEDVAEILSEDPNVEAAEPNHVFRFNSSVPFTEDEYGKNWGLDKIKAKEAWEKMPQEWKDCTGEDIIVAVLDSGVAYNHPDLKDNMWNGSGGCVDHEGHPIPGGCPHHGWDFYNEDDDLCVPGSDDPAGDHSHGTYIAGIIAGVANASGMVGVNPKVKIMAVKMGGYVFGSYDSMIKGLNFSINNGAKIINASFGEYKEQSAIDEIVKNIIFNNFDGLLVTASGNEKNDLDSFTIRNHYPSSYTKDNSSKDNIISVAASNDRDEIWNSSESGSNWGGELVDIYAPGEDINTPSILTSQHLFTAEEFLINNWIVEDFDDNSVFSINPSDDTPYELNTEYSIVYKGNILGYYGYNLEKKTGAGLYFKVWFNERANHSENYLSVAISKDRKSTWITLDNHINYSKLIELDVPEEEYDVRSESFNGDLGKTKTMTYDLAKYLGEEVFFKFTWEVENTTTSYREFYIDQIKVRENKDIGEKNNFSTNSGTSLAAPHVAGVAALVWSANNELRPIEVKDIILTTVDFVDDFYPNTGGHPVVSCGRLNALKAVRKAINDFFKKGTVIYSSDGIDVWEMLTTDGVVGSLGTQKYFDFDTKEREGVVLRGPLLFNDREWWEIYWGEDKDGNDMIGWSRSPVYTNVSYCKKIADIPDQVGEFADKEIEAQYRDAFVKSFIHGYDRISDNDYGMADFKVYKMENGYDGVWYQTFTALERKTAMILNIEKNKVFRLNHEFWSKYLGKLYLGAPLGNEEYEKDANDTIIAIKQKFERGALVYDKNIGEFVVYGPGMIVYSTDDSSYTKDKKGVVLQGPNEENSYEIYWGKDSNGEEIIEWSHDTVFKTVGYALHVGVFSAYEENYKEMQYNYRRVFLKRYFDEYNEDVSNRLGEPCYNSDSGNRYVYESYGVWQQYYGESGGSAIMLNLDEGKAFLIKDKFLDKYISNNVLDPQEEKLGAPLGEEKDNGDTITQQFENGSIVYDKAEDSTSIVSYTLSKGEIVFSDYGLDVFEEAADTGTPKYSSTFTQDKMGLILKGPIAKLSLEGSFYDWYLIYWGNYNSGEEIIGWSANTGLNYFKKVSIVPARIGSFSEDNKEKESTYRDAFLKRYFDEYQEDGANNIGEPFDYDSKGTGVYSWAGVWIQNFKFELANSETALILNLDKGEVFLLRDDLLAEYRAYEEVATALGTPIGEEQESDKTITQQFENGYMVYDKEKQEVTPTVYTFDDIRNHWASKYINFVYENDVVHGYDDGSFGPQNPVTRAELVKMCYRGSGKGKPEVTPNESPFPDLPTTHDMYAYICDAKEKGYVVGREDGTFGPDDPVDRYEAAKIIYNIFEADESEINVPEDDRLSFPDVASIDWAGKYVNWFANIKVDWEDDNKGVRIASGYKNGKFGKDDDDNKMNITRAEMAKIIANTMNLKGTGPKTLFSYRRRARSVSISSSATLGFSYEQIYDSGNVSSPDPIQYPNQEILETETLSYSGDKFDSDGDEMFYFWNTTGGSFTTTDSKNFSSITWTPPDVTLKTTFTIRVERGDGRGKVNYGIFDVVVTPGEEFDYFGSSVSNSGDYAIVGAYGENDRGYCSGSAYIFKKNEDTWIRQTRLLALDGAEGDKFGCSVSIYGDYAIVGAGYDDDKDINSGSAYIFTRQDNTWIEQKKLLASDGAEYDYFGFSVSISGDYAIVGAYGDDNNGYFSGSAYIFKRDGNTWTEQAKLLPSDGATYDYFGQSVSISGDYAIVGAYRDDDNGYCSGSAYIFKRDGNTWIKQTKLLASDGAKADSFGFSVSISVDYAIVGAWKDSYNGFWSGSAYIFKRDGDTWIEQTKLLATDGAKEDLFGVSVSISGYYAIVGAEGDDVNGTKSGSAYIFKRDGDAWKEQAKLLASNGTDNDLFGQSVSISGNYSIVGAERRSTLSGSAFFFTLPEPILSVSPSYKEIPSTSSSFSFAVSNIGSGSMNWTATTDASWIAIETPSGTNDGILNITYPNNDGPDRVAYIAITAEGTKNSPQTITVTQKGKPELSVSPSYQEVIPEDGTVSFNIKNTGYGTMNWTAITETSWITIENPSGVNDGILNISYSENTTGSKRYATILVMAETTKSVFISIQQAFVKTSLEQVKLLHLDVEDSDKPASSVSISADYAIVGIQEQEGSGLAYMFKREGDRWLKQAKLFASDGAMEDSFGCSVSISGDYAIVGASGDDDDGSDSGSAYIFKRDGATWQQQTKLLASDGAEEDNFGCSVSISGDYAIVGAPGCSFSSNPVNSSAYIFRLDGDTWIEQAKLLASDGAEDDRFGYSVSISGDYAIVGSFGDDENGMFSGSAYLYKRLGDVWTKHAKLLPYDGEEFDGFGCSVSIYGDYAIVGADGDDDTGYYSGSAYIYKRDGDNWVKQTKLLASDGMYRNIFGSSVSLFGDYAVVGACVNNFFDELYLGSAYIFKRDGDTWTEQTKLLEYDIDTYKSNDASLVSTSGDYIIVGSLYNDSNGTDSGSAYIYTLSKAKPIPSDANGDGILDLKDLVACLQVLAGGTPSPFKIEAADFNENGRLDLGELIILLEMIQD
ncbi:secreted protein containing Peptidase S8 and S53, subtilisin, kexin, sedolisin domain protein [Candidatus Magnetomorum sp. HK-1]|nr:secreted protein containing Peptidase S8 and S53, subtilisin, kexin, sedolisin domain protein [Candidatus Magnetomorum sp. HK-1]